MSRLFGRRKTENDVQSDADVLTNLAESKDLIEKREAHLMRKLDGEVKDAIEHKAQGRKNQALACLKRKKLIDDELNGLTQRRLTLDAQEHALQSLQFNERAAAVERAATAAIKGKVKSSGGVSKLEEQREEAEETLQDAYDMLGVASEAIAVPGLSQDDDELWAELLALEEDDDARKLEKQLIAVNLADEQGETSTSVRGAFPSIPSLSKEQERELAEIDELTASMRVERPMPMPMMGNALGSLMVPVA